MSDSGDDDMKIPPALIKRWMKEDARLGAEIEKLEKRRASVRSLIAAASPFTPVSTLAPLQSDVPSQLTPDQPAKRVYRGYTRNSKTPLIQTVGSANSSADSKPPNSRKHISKIRKLNRETWSTAILGVMAKVDGPVSYAKLREGLLETSFREKIQKNDKFFYSAVMKLRDNKMIIPRNKHLFLPAAYEKFMKALENNEISDVEALPREYRSKLGDRIMIILRDYPNGLESKDIMVELKRDPEFEYAADPNNTSVYNVLKRLFDLGMLQKQSGRYALVESDDPAQSVKESNDAAEFEMMVDAAISQATGVRH